MSETKLEAKQWGHSENFRYYREILTLRKFRKRNVCEIFAMSNSEIFFIFLIFFEKSNKINYNNNINNNNINNNNKIKK